MYLNTSLYFEYTISIFNLYKKNRELVHSSLSVALMLTIPKIHVYF